jgi:hypothetical protein
MAALGVTTAGGLVVCSPKCWLGVFPASVVVRPSHCGAWQAWSLFLPFPRNSIFFDVATMLDQSKFGASDVAKECHLQHLASLLLPSVDSESMMESRVLQRKQASLSHLDATPQALPTVDDFLKASDATELVQTVQSKVSSFQVAAIDLDLLDSRPSIGQATHKKSQMEQLETPKESLLQQEKAWSQQLAQQVPTKLEQWMATIKTTPNPWRGEVVRCAV